MTVTANLSPLHEYIKELDDIPTDVLLGRIVLFTITDEPVDHADLEKWFDELGLDKDHLPSKIRELDAFKKATSGINKSSYPMTRSREAHLLCRDVTSTRELVKRQITREVQDSQHRRLSYSSAISATFYRATSPNGTARVKYTIQQDAVEREEVDHLMAVTDRLSKDYLRYRDFHDGQKLRALVRDYLKHLAAIEVKGGCYFIHAARDAELAALSELVNRFGGGCMMHTIPIVNLERERKFITQAFEREASESLMEVKKECTDLLSKRKSITPAAYARVKARYDEVLAQAQMHMATLQVSQDVTGASAEVALDALMELQERMLDSP